VHYFVPPAVYLRHKSIHKRPPHCQTASMDRSELIQIVWLCSHLPSTPRLLAVMIRAPKLLLWFGRVEDASDYLPLSPDQRCFNVLVQPHVLLTNSELRQHAM
jgi:hypothetical protein